MKLTDEPKIEHKVVHDRENHIATPYYNDKKLCTLRCIPASATRREGFFDAALYDLNSERYQEVLRGRREKKPIYTNLVSVLASRRDQLADPVQ